MAVIRKEIEIREAPKRVWEYATDFGRMPSWFYGVKAISVSSEAIGSGTERTLTIVTGHSYRERVDRWEPEELLALSVLNPPWFVEEWTASLSLNDRSPGTAVVWEIRLTPRFGALGRLFDRLILAPLIGGLLSLSLRRLKLLSEGTTTLLPHG